MSLCPESRCREVRPGTGRVLVTELSSGGINPTPVSKAWVQHGGLVLSREKLESLCGTQDLSLVTSLEVCVDTRENTLENFGSYMPRLVQLKLNNSTVMSVRDVGTSLSDLKVLWMSRCCLQDLDGISSFSSLQELYVSYNNVSELSQLGLLEDLRLLDLEGNDVDDLVQVQFLASCSKLRTLTLEGNPVRLRPNPACTQTADYRYRAAVRELVPQLRYLDDVKVEEEEEEGRSATEEDWDILLNAIRNSAPSPAAGDAADSDGSAPLRPSTGLQGFRPLSSAGHCGVLSPPESRPASGDSRLAPAEAETSALTHGAGKILFCGNPVQAVRARREKLRTAPTRSSFIPRDLPIHVPEHTYDLDESDPTERVNVFAELRAWRETHSRRLQAIERERSPQVWTLQRGEGEEAESDGEGCDGSGDEGRGGGVPPDSPDNVSPDSSVPPLSADLRRLSLSPDATPSPSPPLAAAAAVPSRGLSGFRTRRLRLNHSHVEDALRTRRGGPEGSTVEDERQNVPPQPPSAHKTHKAAARASGETIRTSSAHKPQTSTFRPAISRPHTARAALQKHLQHHLLRPHRGSAHPD